MPRDPLRPTTHSLRRLHRIALLLATAGAAGLAGCGGGPQSRPSEGPANAPSNPAAEAGSPQARDAVVAPSTLPGYDRKGQNPTEGWNDPRWLDTAPVILISFDGFRWDYVERYRPPAFLRIASEGVMATNGSMPPFPSKTFPSHFSMATGLWAENHELAGNTFWDPERREMYRVRDRDKVEDGSWYGGEPIWVTAESQGMVAASYFFVGSEADVGGVRPSYWYAYDGSVTGEEKVDRVLEWVRMPPETRPRMITLYFPNTDDAGHGYGPDSPEIEAAIEAVDGYLQRLLDGLDAIEGGEEVTVVLVSDHGMYEQPVELSHPVDVSGMEGVMIIEAGPYGAFAVDGDAARRREVRDAIAVQLPESIPVYLREEVPEELHYSATRKVGDIIAVPPLGTTLRRTTQSFAAGWNPSPFNHGWDPRSPEMHGIFLARGPRLRPGGRLDRVRHVDIYPLMAEILGLDPAPVDGSLSTWDPVLVPAGGGR